MYFSCLIAGVPALANPGQVQPGQSPASPGPEGSVPAGLGTGKSGAAQPSKPPSTCSIEGSIADPHGDPVSGAHVTLTSEANFIPRQATSNEDGQFSFGNLAPGAFRLTVVAHGFKAKSISGTLHPGEMYTAPRIVLALAPVVTQVTVTPSRAFMAKYQMQQEEKQLVLGFVPNYYVTYFHDTVPLSPKQKFELAWKSTFYPFIFGLTAAIA